MSISNIGMRQNQVDPEFERSESLVESSHSTSIASLFPPYNSDTDASSESDEAASRFSNLSLTIYSSFSHVLFSPPPTTNLSIASLFPLTISDTESEESNQTPPRLSNSIDSICPPARSPPYRSDTILVTSINDVNHFYQAGTIAKVTPTNLTTSPYLIAGVNLLPSGDLYTGGFRFSKVPRSTLGTLKNLNPYTESVTENVPHGLGKYLWTDGCMYAGGWHGGKAYGKGKFSWPSGATYEGMFKLGQMEGFGIFIGANGDTYRGSWRSDWKHGYGQKRYVNGDLYVGLWKRSVQDGHGRYIWNNGNEYIGEWKNGLISGCGILIWANGNNYNGEWENGVPKGDGVFTWANGSCYVGRWNKDHQMKGTFYPWNGNSNGENLIITIRKPPHC